MIIPMEAEYTDLVMDIWLRSVTPSHAFIPETYWQDRYETVKNTYLPQSETFLFEAKDGTLQGFISLMAAEGKFQPKRPQVQGRYISALFVDPDYQGQGCGTALLNYCKDQYDELYLAVYNENEFACQFYEEQGFTWQSEQPNDETNCMESILFWSDDQDWCNLLLGMHC